MQIKFYYLFTLQKQLFKEEIFLFFCVKQILNILDTFCLFYIEIIKLRERGVTPPADICQILLIIVMYPSLCVGQAPSCFNVKCMAVYQTNMPVAIPRHRGNVSSQVSISIQTAFLCNLHTYTTTNTRAAYSLITIFLICGSLRCGKIGPISSS